MFYFRNPGTLPLLAITTLGISAKESDNPIGRFGTGLKYVIAGALRLNQELSIETGGKTYYFSAIPEEVRGKTFHVVQMTEIVRAGPQILENITRLGFTTDLGKHWEPWMYIRELWSNMKDEGGSHGVLSAMEPISSDETRIIVGGKILEEAYARLDEFILPLHKMTPVTKDFGAELYATPFGSRKIYFQGILVGEFDKPMSYTLNIIDPDDIILQEDRKIGNMWYPQNAYKRVILSSSDEALLEDFMTAKNGRGEHDLEVSDYQLRDTARAVMQRIWNESPYKLTPNLGNLASRMLRPDDTSTIFEPSQVEQEKFDKALAFIQSLGFDRGCDWIFVNPPDVDAFGFVRKGKIYLCKMAFNNGTQFLAQVMMEEYLHLHKDLGDFTREMQNELFAKVISLGEELHGRL